MKIAVAGATGRVGHHVVDVLAERAHEVVPMSRRTGVDLISGAGLDEALAGVEAVIDAATGPSPDEQEATEFFTTAAKNLQAAAAGAGVQRIVAVSIVGADKFAGGYGIAKIAHERATLAGPVPGRVLRATQFHEFVEQLMSWGRQGDSVAVPAMRTQLVAARTVAEALAGLALDPSLALDGTISDIAGPRAERLVEVAALLAARMPEPLTVHEVSNPDDPDAALLAGGGLLPDPGAVLAGPTFAEWLATAS